MAMEINKADESTSIQNGLKYVIDRLCLTSNVVHWIGVLMVCQQLVRIRNAWFIISAITS